MKPALALVSARAAHGLDEDEQPLVQALRETGARVEVADWDDPAVRWDSFDLAVLRSTWDYTQRLEEFLGWVERVSRLTALRNPAAVVRWNTDKHYLLELTRAGVPTVPSTFIEPGTDAAAAVSRFVAQLETAELVVKPAVGAGSIDARRYTRAERDAAIAHARRLIDAGRSALLQPYLDLVEHYGETALIFYAGRFDHAIRKGVMLPAPKGEGAGEAADEAVDEAVDRGGEGGRAGSPSAARSGQGLFVPETITARTPQADELEIAVRALAAIPHEELLYARVDLIRDAAGAPVLLELELTEPSLFLAHSPGSAQRLAQLLLDHARHLPCSFKT